MSVDVKSLCARRLFRTRRFGWHFDGRLLGSMFENTRAHCNFRGCESFRYKFNKSFSGSNGGSLAFKHGSIYAVSTWKKMWHLPVIFHQQSMFPHFNNTNTPSKDISFHSPRWCQVRKLNNAKLLESLNLLWQFFQRYVWRSLINLVVWVWGQRLS